MKENLILKKFKTEPIPGTFSMKESRTFFGAKMLEIEDEITIDNRTIQYSELEEDGMQVYDFDVQGSTETFRTPNLNELKENNHNIFTPQQNRNTLRNNTLWNIEINLRQILQDYIFYKIKERRTFKGIRKENVINKNVNPAIYEYILENVLNRYKFDKIDFYVRYKSISVDQDVLSEILLKFSPNFDPLIKEDRFKIQNINVETNKDAIETLKIAYNQIKPSIDYKFDYYFDLKFKKR
jgi:hypothetical protein